MLQTLVISRTRLLEYWDVTKPRLVWLVLVSTAAGFYLASGQGSTVFLHTLFATGMVAAGSQTLNQWMEREYDARMQRTADRSLPSGRMQPLNALIWGMFLSASGLVYLSAVTNPVCVGLASGTLLIYLVLYTPLKRFTSLCTIVGAIPGALPPLIGWSAASQGQVPFQAWVLFFIIFLWQMPHFLAIAWMYRDDYERAGFKVLSVEDREGFRVARQMVVYTLALLPVSLVPAMAGLCNGIYFAGALILSLAFILTAIYGAKDLERHARLIFRASIIYLPLLLLLMVLNKAI